MHAFFGGDGGAIVKRLSFFSHCPCSYFMHSKYVIRNELFTIYPYSLGAAIILTAHN